MVAAPPPRPCGTCGTVFQPNNRAHLYCQGDCRPSQRSRATYGTIPAPRSGERGATRRGAASITERRVTRSGVATSNSSANISNTTTASRIGTPSIVSTRSSWLSTPSPRSHADSDWTLLSSASSARSTRPSGTAGRRRRGRTSTSSQARPPATIVSSSQGRLCFTVPLSTILGCSKCTATFRSKTTRHSDVVKHYREAHPGVPVSSLSFSCSLCGTNSNTLARASSHLRLCGGPATQSEPTEMEGGGDGEVALVILAYPPKPSRCPLCPYVAKLGGREACAVANNLKSHLYLVHQQHADHKWLCSVCKVVDSGPVMASRHKHEDRLASAQLSKNDCPANAGRHPVQNLFWTNCLANAGHCLKNRMFCSAII